MEENYINTNPDEQIILPSLTSFTYPDENGAQIFGHYDEDGNEVIGSICECLKPSTILFSSLSPNSEIRFSDIIVETRISALFKNSDKTRERNCYNCAYYQKDGGDRVPYGSTFAITPEVEYCELNEDEDDVTPLEPCDLWEKRK